MTSCGYAGFIPLTHESRVLAGLGILGGFAFVFVAAAAVTARNDLDPGELILLRAMQMRKLRTQAQEAAASLVQFVWRSCRRLRRFATNPPHIGKTLATDEDASRRLRLGQDLAAALRRLQHFRSACGTDDPDGAPGVLAPLAALASGGGFAARRLAASQDRVRRAEAALAAAATAQAAMGDRLGRLEARQEWYSQELRRRLDTIALLLPPSQPAASAAVDSGATQSGELRRRR